MVISLSHAVDAVDKNCGAFVPFVLWTKVPQEELCVSSCVLNIYIEV